MSLADSLRNAIRQRIPDDVLHKCLPHDRAVVENAVYVLSECSQHISLERLSIEKQGNTYIVCVPMTGEFEMGLADLRQVENYSPARVLDLRVCVSPSSNCVKLVIGDETRQALVSECDIVRVRKRRRWGGLFG